MKTLAYVLIGFVSIICLPGILSSNVEASDYLGDFCWTIAHENVPMGIAKASVLDIGGGQYLLSGKMTDSDGNVYIGHANALFEGDNILLTISGSASSNQGMLGGTVHVVLENFTLNGTWQSVGLDVSYADDSINTDKENGSATLISCPQ